MFVYFESFEFVCFATDLCEDLICSNIAFYQILIWQCSFEDRGTSQNGLEQIVLAAPTVPICTLGRLRYLQFSVRGDGQFSRPDLLL